MKKIISLSVLFGAMFFAFQSCGGDKTQPASSDSVKPNATVSASVDGKTLYDAKCTTCHGGDGTAGVMGDADLSKSKLDHAAACAIVKNGKSPMKAFGGELNDAEVDAVTKYIESLRK